MCQGTTPSNVNNTASTCITTNELPRLSHSTCRPLRPSSQLYSHYGTTTHTKASVIQLLPSSSNHHKHKHDHHHHHHHHHHTSSTPDHSLAVLFTVTLITEAARGLLLPSLWPYFNSVGGTKQGYGLLIAFYSLGRMISVIPVGHLCDDGSHLSHTAALIITSFIQAFGHLGYALCRTPVLLLLSRMIVGFGSASTSIARAHITKTVSTERRTTVLAYMSGVQFIGFAVLPALGGWMMSLVNVDGLHVNDENINNFNENDFAAAPVKQGQYALFSEFTIAAWMLVLANMICAVFALVFYKEPVPFDSVNIIESQAPPPPACMKNRRSSLHHSPSCSPLHEAENQPLLLKSCNNNNISSTITSSSSSSSSPLLNPTTTIINRNSVTSTCDIIPIVTALVINLVLRGVLAQLEAISIPFLVEQFHVSYVSAGNNMTMLGLLGTIIYFSFRPLAVFFSDRALIAIGLLLVVFGSLPLSFPFLSNAMSVAVYLIFLGQAWCVAYPIGQTAVLALFSKAVDGRKGVAAFMGLFSASGAISPLVLSVVATLLWEKWGREAVFGFMCFTVLLGLGLMAVTYHKLDIGARHRKG